MLKYTHIALIFLFLSIFALGCSGGSPDLISPPETPVNISEAELTPDDPLRDTQESSQHMLWGLWQINFDPEKFELSAEPARNLQAHWNITNMVIPPACDDCLDFSVNNFNPTTQILDVDVTVALLEDSHHFDDRVDVAARRRIPANRRLIGVLQEVGQLPYS